MSHKTTVKTGNTRAGIRRVALLGAVAVGCTGIVLGLCFGRTFLQACSGGAAGALGCLAGWFTYHVVSRRDDGLAILIGGNLGPMTNDRPISFWPTLMIVLVVNVAIGWIFGRFARGSIREESHPLSGEAMYDAQLDQPD